MSTNLTPKLPERGQSIQTRHLFTMQLAVKPIINIGRTPNGFRRMGIVPGGTFIGDRLSGIVLDGGNDWQLLRPDNSVLLNVRLPLQTDQGDMISMTYQGIRAGDSGILKRIDAGEIVDPSTYYFRMAPLFETASATHAWLNNIIAIGTGHRSAEGVIYTIFEVL